MGKLVCVCDASQRHSIRRDLDVLLGWACLRPFRVPWRILRPVVVGNRDSWRRRKDGVEGSRWDTY